MVLRFKWTHRDSASVPDPESDAPDRRVPSPPEAPPCFCFASIRIPHVTSRHKTVPEKLFSIKDFDVFLPWISG